MNALRYVSLNNLCAGPRTPKIDSTASSLVAYEVFTTTEQAIPLLKGDEISFQNFIVLSQTNITFWNNLA